MDIGSTWSAPAAEGNYLVRIALGDPEGPSSTDVLSGTRRLMLEGVAVPAGGREERAIAVNVRSPGLAPPPPNAPGGARVLLAEEEEGSPGWQPRIALSFEGRAPAVLAVEAEPADLPTLYLAGDSTVADQPGPMYASWGQMLPLFLGPGIAVANHARSGETLKSFISSLRLAKVLERMRPGDYFLVQFCHNDQKKEWPQTYAEAGSTYEAYLRAYIEEARARLATPILATAPQRRRLGPDGRARNTHGPYPDAVRELASREGLVLVDLEAASRSLYEALGPELSRAAFAVSGDETHHGLYGARQLAKFVARELGRSGLPLAACADPAVSLYDPARPDPPPGAVGSA